MARQLMRSAATARIERSTEAHVGTSCTTRATGLSGSRVTRGRGSDVATQHAMRSSTSNGRFPTESPM
jgi:hypothetical protein